MCHSAVSIVEILLLPWQLTCTPVCPTLLLPCQRVAGRYIARCVAESMRLYPHPPVLLRRALVPDTLPGGYEVPRGQDVMISVYNIHHSPQVCYNRVLF